MPLGCQWKRFDKNWSEPESRVVLLTVCKLFLSAEWRLLVFTYVENPAVLRPPFSRQRN